MPTDPAMFQIDSPGAATSALVPDLEVHGGRARVTRRRPDLSPIAPVELPFD